MFNNKAISVFQNLEMLATVQECQDTHSSTVVQTILMNTEGGNTQTIQPKRLVGQTWGHFVLNAIRASETLKVAFNPLALVHEEEINPCPEYAKKIEVGDKISIIAHHNFDWDHFEKELCQL